MQHNNSIQTLFTRMKQHITHVACSENPGCETTKKKGRKYREETKVATSSHSRGSLLGPFRRVDNQGKHVNKRHCSCLSCGAAPGHRINPIQKKQTNFSYFSYRNLYPISHISKEIDLYLNTFKSMCLITTGFIYRSGYERYVF